MITITPDDQILGNSLLDAAIYDPNVYCVYADWREEHGFEGRRDWHAGKMTKLDDDQVSLIPYFKDYWLRAVLCGGETNMAAAEKAVWAAYEIAELAPPTKIHWHNSIHAAGRTVSRLRPRERGENVLWTLRLNEIKDAISQRVKDAVEALIDLNAWEVIWREVWDAVNNAVILNNYPLQSASWLAAHAYLLTVGRLQCCQPIIPQIQLAHHCGWWWANKDRIILTKKPVKVVIKDGKLRYMRYPDGNEFGVRPKD